MTGQFILVIIMYASLLASGDGDFPPVLYGEKMTFTSKPMSARECKQKAYVLNHIRHYHEPDEHWGFIIQANCWEIL